MRRMLIAAALAAVLAGAAGCARRDADLEELCAWMTGSFSSAAQAAADSSYFDVEMELAPMWTGRDDARWFYVEQAVAAAKDRPYRQRVYRVVRLDAATFESRVYSPPTPERWIGAWRANAPLAAIGPEDLVAREGCAVVLRRDAQGRFAGGTRERECVSVLHGAAYATSEVVVADGLIESWDRGFDADGAQVWGAVKGPYVFLRKGAAAR